MATDVGGHFVTDVASGVATQNYNHETTRNIRKMIFGTRSVLVLSDFFVRFPPEAGRRGISW